MVHAYRGVILAFKLGLRVKVKTLQCHKFLVVYAYGRFMSLWVRVFLIYTE